jgi:acyl carrier protein
MAEPVDSKEKQTKIMEIISTEILETDSDFDENTDLYSAGLDSMATMQLVIRIEQNFGVKLPANKITKENFSSVAALARII